MSKELCLGQTACRLHCDRQPFSPSCSGTLREEVLRPSFKEAPEVFTNGQEEQEAERLGAPEAYRDL